MGTGRLLLIRHAESEGNRDRLYTPHPEVPLTERGHAQAAAAADWLAGSSRPRVIVSSPFRRARQTAAILATRAGVPIEIEPDLRERNYGALAGLPYETPRPDYDHSAYWTWRPPEGESLIEVVERAGAALDRIARNVGVDEAIVVSHGAVMVALWRHVTGAWGEPRVVPNAGVVEVEHRSGTYLAARHLVRDADAESAWRR
jgi:probable phosphoglycerate mutase